MCPDCDVEFVHDDKTNSINPVRYWNPHRYPKHDVWLCKDCYMKSMKREV
jgi:methionine synthase II (cobalamin-independent)